MDFSAIDLRALLKASIPVRFADLSPYDFEDFIAELFRRDGYDVEETPYSGDFGADLVIRKDGVTSVVQVKRYGRETVVGVSDLNQVIGARSYYDAQEALVITTSHFTQGAIQLARNTSVILWDWPKLEQYISTVFLEGEDYHSYFKEEIDQDQIGDPAFQLHFHRLELEDEYDGRPAISMFIGIENCSDENVYLHLELPLVVSKNKRQVGAAAWRPDFFHEGLLVAGATTEVACYYLKEQVNEVKPGDRMIVRIHVRGRIQPVIIDQKLGLPRSGCYIVTLCFGSSSTTYREMIAWREALRQTAPGTWLVHKYYQWSPRVVRYILTCQPGARMLTRCLRLAISLIIRWRGFRKRMRAPVQCQPNDARLLNDAY